MLVTDIHVMETWSGPVPSAASALAAALVAHTAASARHDKLSSNTRAPFVLFECAHYKSECRACVRGDFPSRSRISTDRWTRSGGLGRTVPGAREGSGASASPDYL